MVQHLLLMVVAAPLILIGIRRSLRLRWRPPLVFCWFAGGLTTIVWHVPLMFELAMKFSYWHIVEQASFFIVGLLFWYPVMFSVPAARTWMLPLYLFLATLPCDVLSAFLSFGGRIVYRQYLSDHGRMFGLSPLEDQVLAGAVMWLTVTFAYLIPALALSAQALSGDRFRTAEAEAS
jgi:putative membrane protein